MTARRLSAAILAIPAFLAHAGAAQAFDTLEELVLALPEGEEENDGIGEFYFMSPRLTADWPVQSLVGIGYDPADRALLDPQIGIDQVGIDFTALDGFAFWGTPPATILYLLGEGIDRDAVREVLLQRPDMTETELNDLPLLVEGEEDFGVYPELRDTDYPFGNAWRAQRILLGQGSVGFAHATSLIELAYEAAEAAGDSDLQMMMSEMVRAARLSAPDGFEAYSATIFPGRFYVPSGPDAEQLAAEPVPPFFASLYVASLSDDWEATQMALAYLDADDAAVATETIAATLADAEQMPAGAKVTSSIVPGSDRGAIAVVSVIFPPGMEDHPSSEMIRRWMADLMAGRLRFLSVEAE